MAARRPRSCPPPVCEAIGGNSIGYVIEDGQGYLWVGSNGGLTRVAKKSLQGFAERTNSLACRTYVSADGLPTEECTQGSQPAACRSSDGRLWLPTTQGLVSVNPLLLQPNPYETPVVIESVLVEGKREISNLLRTDPRNTVVVPPGNEHLEIHFTSLNLGAAQQSRFRYRL